MMFGKKILIAENYHLTRDFLKKKLSHKKYEVETAENGEDVLFKIKNFLPDLVILDITILSTSGPELLKKIKEDEITSKIPVIISLNVEDKEEINYIKSLGADDYFLKINFDLREIVDKVKTILEEKKAEKESERYNLTDSKDEEKIDNDYKEEEYIEEEKDEENNLLDKALEEIQEEDAVASDEEQTEEDVPREEKRKEDEFKAEEDFSLDTEHFQEPKNLEESKEDIVGSEIFSEKISEKKKSFLYGKVIFLALFLIFILSFFIWKSLPNKDTEVELTEEEKCLSQNMYWHEGECYEDEETFIFLNNILREKECLRDGMYWHEGECYEDEETFVFLNDILKEKECLRDGMFWKDGECHQTLE